MSFLAWIVLGLISGFIASKIVNKSGEGVVMDIVLGIVGAVAGGWLFNKSRWWPGSGPRTEQYPVHRPGWILFSPYAPASSLGLF